MKFLGVRGACARGRQVEVAVPPEEAVEDDEEDEAAEDEDWPAAGAPADELALDAVLDPEPLAEAPLLRKSVTYQPEPLSWKPAAVTCLA